MPLDESKVQNDIDDLGEEPIPHRSPEKIETTIVPTLKPEREGEEEEPPQRRQRRETPVEEVEEEEEETPATRRVQNDEMRAAMAELATTVTKVVKEKPEQPAKQMTQAEMEAYWGIYKPDPKDLRTLFRGIPDDATPEQLAEHAAIFKKVQDGLVKQAFVAAQRVFNEELKKRDAQIEQFESYRQTQTARQVREEFNSRYKELAETKFDKILRAVATEIEADPNAKFFNNQQYFDELAKRSAEYIREIDPNFELGEPSKTRSTGKLPKLPRSGGGGGTGNTNRTTNGKRTGTEVTADRNDIDSLT